MKTVKATKGDAALYERLKTGFVSAINGNSNAGKGWRPVSNGLFLGKKCYDTEKQAIDGGIIFIADLKTRVTEKQKKPKKERPAKLEVNNG